MTINLDYIDMDWSINGIMAKKPDVLPDDHATEMEGELALPCEEHPFAFLRETCISVPENHSLRFTNVTTTLSLKFQ